ncbi:MAG TPA: YraN family protein [Anaerolineales bacterium]|nr:YraN family protein [Anaerolineales bacterium]
MKSIKRQSLGRVGESLAGAFLKNKGYVILEKNWRSPYGEIDMVASKNEAIIFVEVKTRANNSLGPPEISITPRKTEHMRNAAEYYIQQHPELNAEWRIDLITIQIQPDGQPTLIDHFENVLS